MILHIPYFEASGAIFSTYFIGSLNSSSVGLYVGASSKPCGLTRFGASRFAEDGRRLSIVDRSRGADRRTLKGMLALEMPLGLLGALAGAGPAWAELPPSEGGTTISGEVIKCWYGCRCELERRVCVAFEV